MVKDIKIDGKTRYFCNQNEEACLIEAALFSNPNLLLVANIAEENDGELSNSLWLTKKDYLTLLH